MITVGWHEAGDGERAGEGGVGDFGSHRSYRKVPIGQIGRAHV